jgi:membrane peptidoglycan carboxypeptidase
VKTASEEFFNKPMAELSISESATLAVMVRNPSLYNPRSRPELTLERRDEVIREMQENGWITQAQADVAVQDPIGVIEAPLRRGPADHVVAEVKRQLLNGPEFDFLGTTPEERKKAVFGCPADDVACEGGGGLQVFTTIDLELQHKANEILRTWMPLPPYEENLAHCREILPNETDDFLARYAETHSCVPTGAMTMVDNWTGAVKVMASGLPFEFSQFDLAVQGRRNPGSSFKPFGLIAALENGFTMGHSWSGASPIKIECPFPCAPNGSNIWTVRNAGASFGVIDLAEATYNSVNAVYAQLSLEVGPEKIVDMAKRMGIDESALDPVLSIVLGSSAVSTKEMANAYSNFATYGQHADDYIVSRIVDSAGETIYEHQPEITQVADPAIFAAANRALKVVPVSGTAPRANIGIPQGGKTGTHQSYLDAWYVGYTPEYSTAVWVGYEAQQVPLTNVTINGQGYDRVFGGSVPAPIWAEFMSYVHAGLPVTDFPPDPGNIQKFLVPPPTTVPNVIGEDESGAKAALREARLNASIEPVPSLEPAGTVVNQSPGGGATVRQGSFVTVYISTGEIPVGAVPNLQGLTFDEAVEIVRSFELDSGVLVNLIQAEAPTTDPAMVGRIVATEPPPGTPVQGAIDIVARVGVIPGQAPPPTQPSG